jgi:hypothetical protein
VGRLIIGGFLSFGSLFSTKCEPGAVGSPTPILSHTFRFDPGVGSRNHKLIAIETSDRFRYSVIIINCTLLESRPFFGLLTSTT